MIFKTGWLHKQKSLTVIATRVYWRSNYIHFVLVLLFLKMISQCTFTENNNASLIKYEFVKLT